MSANAGPIQLTCIWLILQLGFSPRWLAEERSSTESAHGRAETEPLSGMLVMAVPMVSLRPWEFFGSAI